MSDDPHYQVHVSGDAHTIRALKNGRKALQRSGIVMIVIGALAIIFPMASTYTVQFIIGATFLVAGVLMLAGSFAIHGTGPFFGALLWSLLMVAVGAFLVFNPAGGAAALTLLIAGLFMVHGAFELFLALSIRPQEGWGWMLASAIVGIVVGLLIAGGLPGTSRVLIGLLVGINFLATGVAFVFLAQRLQKDVRVHIDR